MRLKVAAMSQEGPPSVSRKFCFPQSLASMKIMFPVPKPHTPRPAHFFSQLKIYIYLYLWGQEHMCHGLNVETRENFQALVSPVTMWVPRMEFRSSGLADTITH